MAPRRLGKGHVPELTSTPVYYVKERQAQDPRRRKQSLPV